MEDDANATKPQFLHYEGGVMEVYDPNAPSPVAEPWEWIASGIVILVFIIGMIILVAMTR